MPGRHLVIRAMIPAFEQGPETLKTVCMNGASYILKGRMPYRFMVFKAYIGTCFIRVHRRTGSDRPIHKCLQRLAICVVHHLGPNMAGLTIPDARHRRLTRGTTATMRLLVSMFILFQAANERFICFHRATKEPVCVRVLPRLAYSVRQVPRTFLRDIQISVQLHAGYTLETGTHQVTRKAPYVIAQMGTLHHRTHPNAEALITCATAMGHGLVGCAHIHVIGSAAYTRDAVRPSLLDEPLFCRRTVREHAEDFEERNRFAEVQSRCIVRHCFSSPLDAQRI